MISAHIELPGQLLRRPARLVEPAGFDGLLVYETAPAHRHLGPTEVRGNRPPIDAELGGEHLHGLACLVPGDQCIDLSTLEEPDGGRPGDRHGDRRRSARWPSGAQLDGGWKRASCTAWTWPVDAASFATRKTSWSSGPFQVQ